MKIVIVVHHRFELWNAPEWFASRMRAAFPQVEFAQHDDYRDIEKDLADADAAITWSLRPEQVRAARRLRWIHSPAAAVHQLMFAEIVNSNIVVTNARGLHGPVVAEHAIAQILAMAKRLPSAVRWQAKRVWAQDQIWQERPRPREVAGSTLGLIGVGSIGREVARIAVALNMRVMAVREHPEKGIDWEAGSGSSAVFGPDQLDEVLRNSDYVVIAAPITWRTKALFDATRLAQMRQEAYLINVSRGALVDERALAEAVRKGTIAGAALDVFEHEPLAAGSPLWGFDNVLITPHTAALTEKLWHRHFEQISENLRRFLAGEPLLSVVDKNKGY